jgi:hypothetical protein
MPLFSSVWTHRSYGMMVPMCLYMDKTPSPPRVRFCKLITAFGSAPDMATALGLTPLQKQQRLLNAWSTICCTKEFQRWSIFLPMMGMKNML